MRILKQIFDPQHHFSPGSGVCEEGNSMVSLVMSVPQIVGTCR